MKMELTKMKLTKKSKETLYNRYNGYGVVFLKTGDREMCIIEINLSSNGKFYTMNGRLLTERLNELSVVMKEKEMKRDGVFVEITALGTVNVYVRRWGKEEIFAYHLPTLLRNRDSYFRMERKNEKNGNIRRSNGKDL